MGDDSDASHGPRPAVTARAARSAADDDDDDVEIQRHKTRLASKARMSKITVAAAIEVISAWS
jgi:hypothetical protein